MQKLAPSCAYNRRDCPLRSFLSPISPPHHPCLDSKKHSPVYRTHSTQAPWDVPREDLSQDISLLRCILFSLRNTTIISHVSEQVIYFPFFLCLTLGFITFPRWPRLISSDITVPSLSGSIGGLVTFRGKQAGRHKQRQVNQIESLGRQQPSSGGNVFGTRVINGIYGGLRLLRRLEYPRSTLENLQRRNRRIGA